MGVCHVAAELLVAVGTCPADGVPVTVTPSMAVALLVPVLATVSDEPAPRIIAAAVLVPLVIPLNGTAVAVIVPEPVGPSEAPVPTNIAAAVLVPEAIALNGLEYADAAN